ncbi:MAG: cytochrome c [Salaquimonas sp.]|jgi:mono/diheme cytochrome c family protein|nr:cytochrome c [Salaquimonas sp.]
MKRIAAALVIIAIVAAVMFYWLTMPSRLPSDVLAGLDKGDAVAGERMFNAGGCVSCHGDKDAASGTAPMLGGGLALVTPFGTFHTPNISPDPQTGIGKWSFADFANAMLRGVSPSGAHFYPAFPYTSYARMKPQDVADLWAYLKTLPPVVRANKPHELSFPFTIRRGLGLWQLLYLSPDPVIAIDESDPQLVRGRYLVEGPGHCGECHTPRNLIGGLDKARWLGGGPAPEGGGKIPNITPDPSGIGSWSAADIAYYLESGFTPDFDSVGGAMVEVQRNMVKLTAEDRQAIAAYLKAVPPVASAK